jgi:hypothetical protein
MTGGVAILIEADGEIATLRFAGLAEPDRPGGRLWHIRAHIDSADPRGLELPHSRGLVAWFDGRAHLRMRSVNVIGSVFVTEAFDLPLRMICGPLMITGGSSAEPKALAAAQVADVFELLKLEAGDTAAED